MINHRSRPQVVLFLGAGFSYVAGMPLTKDLLSGSTYIPSEWSAREWSALLEDYCAWTTKHPDKGVEQYLSEVYTLEFGPRATLWPAAVRLVAATVGTPRHGEAVAGRVRYSSMITRSYRNSIHKEFWDTLLRVADVIGVVTTNYDVLVERSLRHRQMRGRPGFHYGGLAVPLQAIGWVNPFRPSWKREPTVIEGRVPLCKLHGSVNWYVEQGVVHVYTDTRAVFRRNKPCAIIPPTPDKQIPNWLNPIWDKAYSCLSQTDQWVICGYSLPEYDVQVRALLQASAREAKRILLIDPNSGRDERRWKDLLPNSTITPIAGLPEALPIIAHSLATETER